MFGGVSKRLMVQRPDVVHGTISWIHFMKNILHDWSINVNQLFV